MIISVEEIKELIEVNMTDKTLDLKLKGLENAIREYTNNNFQIRNARFQCSIENGKLSTVLPPFTVGDTVQISKSLYNEGVYELEAIDGKLSEVLIDEPLVTVTLVRYPKDIKAGVVDIIKWENSNRDKIGISSETISRHSVTYSQPTGDNSVIGYPKELTTFLQPYMKARF